MRLGMFLPTAILLLACSAASATPATDELFANYKTQGAGAFDAGRGGQAWDKEHNGAEGRTMTCHTCHGQDLGKEGKHHKTGKVIQPMAPSVNKERYTDAKKIEKWFKRNCNDVLGRECSAQEKGDFLKFLLGK